MPPAQIVYSPGPVGGDGHRARITRALARMLPFLEQNPIYNAINFNFGARWGDGTKSDIAGNMNGSTADCDTFGLMNASAAANQINSFLCPSDTDLANLTYFIFTPGGVTQYVGRHNYPINAGSNPFRAPVVSGGTGGGALNGAVYIPGFQRGLTNAAGLSNNEMTGGIRHPPGALQRPGRPTHHGRRLHRWNEQHGRLQRMGAGRRPPAARYRLGRPERQGRPGSDLRLQSAVPYSNQFSGLVRHGLRLPANLRQRRLGHGRSSTPGRETGGSTTSSPTATA